jgi:sugar lactone lactonase YvrE
LLISSGTGLKPACVFASTAFAGPLGAIFDKDNNLFVAQNGDTTIVRINAADLSLTNPACSPGPVSLTPGHSVDQHIHAAQHQRPVGLAFAKNGNLWVSNEQNVAPNNSGTGTLVVFAASDITTTHIPIRYVCTCA